MEGPTNPEVTQTCDSIPRSLEVSKEDFVKDKIMGMLVGVALGDALGAPHEFRCSKEVYDGVLRYSAAVPSRFVGVRYLPVGSITDDTQMTMALARNIGMHGRYVRDKVALAYMRWANVARVPMGRNTRAVLKGVKTISGWQGRMAPLRDLPLEQQSHSNGPLMRCAPLALLPTLEAVPQDVSITNPYPPVIDAVLVHVYLLRLLLATQPGDRTHILQYLEAQAAVSQTPAVRQTLEDASRQESSRDLVTQKCWIMHGIWLTARVLRNPDLNSFPRVMQEVIRSYPGSDTDTNAAIVGGAIGSWFGYRRLMSGSGEYEQRLMEHNVRTVIAANQRTNVLQPQESVNDQGGPLEFGLSNLEELVNSLATIVLQSQTSHKSK